MFDQVQESIIRKLKETEETNQVEIVFAVESGSRGWGFASKDSDYDCRFVYLSNIDCYLSLHEPKDVIGYPVDKVYDVQGWDLKKMLLLMTKSNCAALEWLTSPIVYRRDNEIVRGLEELGEIYFKVKPSMYHYLSQAKKHQDQICAEDKVKIKNYFYLLRTALSAKYIMENEKMPPMHFDTMCWELGLPAEIKSKLKDLYEQKRTGEEGDLLGREDLVLEYTSALIKSGDAYAESYVQRKTESTDKADAFFAGIVKGQEWNSGGAYGCFGDL